MDRPNRTSGVVVGYDGSGFAVRALEWALDEAELRGRPLTVCHAWQRPPEPEDGDALRHVAEHVAEQGVIRARARAVGPPVHVDLYEGSAAERLLELSAEADLVVVGAYGRRTMERARSGAGGRVVAATGRVVAAAGRAVPAPGGAVATDPVAEAGRAWSVGRVVAARARCPVVIVRGAGPPPGRTGPIVVGVNGGCDMDVVLDFAFREAVARRVPLVAVHAWYQYAQFAGTPHEPTDPADVRAAAEERVERVLEPWRARYPDVPIEVSAAEGPARQELLEAALDASLLVVGAPYARCGSMTAFLLNHAPCPVAIVRPQEVDL